VRLDTMGRLRDCVVEQMRNTKLLVNPRELITAAERSFPVRVRIAVRMRPELTLDTT
jgi:hypothetical protein